MVPWGWTALAVGGACAFVLLCDIALRGYHQRSAAMDVVWPLTALYLGPLGAWLYLRHARPATARWVSRHPEDVGGTVVGAPRGTAADHCGAWGAVCLLASLAGGGLAQLLSPTPVLPLEPEQAVSLAALGIGDLALACLFGLVFRRLSHEQSAARRTLVRIAAFQLPVLACIAVNRLLFQQSPDPPPAPAQWLPIQVGLAVGFLVCWVADGWRHPSTDALRGATIRGWRRAWELMRAR